MNIKRYISGVRMVVPVSLMVCVLMTGPAVGQQETRAEQSETAIHKDNPVRIPYGIYGQHLVVPVTVSGSRELLCILDTGMSRGLFLMNPDTGAELGLKYSQKAMVGGAGEGDPRYADLAMGISFKVAGIEFSDERAIVLDELPLYMDSRVDGIVGKSVFDRFVVEVDFESEVVLLHRPESFDSSGAGIPVPLEIRHQKPFIDATVRIDNSHDIPVSLVVDLGAGHALALNRDMDPKLPTPDRTIIGLLGTGIKGDVFGAQGRIRHLQIGGYVLNGVVSSFPDDTRESGLGPIARNGNLGLGVLKRFTVTFDYSRNRMYLRPNQNFGEPFEINMAGIRLRHAGDDEMIVYYVRKYSPGFKAGLEKGDVVLAVDGQKVSELSEDQVDDMFTQEGETLTLYLQRGDRTFTARIILEQQI